VNKILFASVALISAGVPVVLSAQTAAPNKVGVIQVQAALAATKEGQAALAKLEKDLVEPKRKQIEGRQNEIKDLQDKAQKGANTMSATAKEDLQRQIDQKSKSLNREMEDAQADLEGEQGKIVQELLGKMAPIIEKYAQDNGFSLIMDVSDPQRSGVFWAAAAVDITQAIVDLYDKAPPGAAPSKPAAAPAKAPAAAPTKPVTPAKPPATAPTK
jgi:outer membrane protein